MRSVSNALILTLAVAVLIVAPCEAGDRCCAHCGCENGCQKVCRLVCEDKKVDVVCWGCKSEDFCIGGPSKLDCRHFEWVCDSCEDSKAPQGEPKNFVWSEWLPACSAKIYTKKKLMKKVVTKKVPSFKWVVEDLCEKCETDAPVAVVPAGATIPPPPAVDAKLNYGLLELPQPTATR